MALNAERRFLRPSHLRRLVPVSQGLAREANAFYPAMAPRTLVIENGWSPEKSQGTSGDRAEARAEIGIDAKRLVALFAGGDWHRKGLWVAIDALADAPSWSLIVAGRGDADRLRAEAASRGMAERIVNIGFRTDIHRWYAAADAFVFPTAYECGPLVGYEAAAAGLPIVAPRVSGLEDLLMAGAGIVTDREATAIARSLNELEPAEVRLRFAQRARSIAAGFTWAQAARRYADLYRELAIGAPTRLDELLDL